MAGIFRSLVLLLCFSVTALFAQDAGTILHGVVTDPSGKAVPGASVVLSSAGQASRAVQTDAEGRYEFRGVAAGLYALHVEASGFAVAGVERYRVEAASQEWNVALKLATTTHQVSVSDSATTLDTSADHNAGALVVTGRDLDALADDPDDLAADLAALAGPAAGPNGGQIYINGFTGGRLPPKSSILEVRVNQSPFSALYDRLGFGRVEIVTKPGEAEFHGDVLFRYGSDLFNSRNPFAGIKPPYEKKHWEGEVTGPLGKHTTFSADFEIRRMRDDEFVDAVTLGPNYATVPVSLGVVAPVANSEADGSLDRQVSANHTLSLHYNFALDTRENQDVGGFSLPERAYGTRDSENTFELVETAVHGQHLTNDLHFRYSMTRSQANGASGGPTTSVRDSFIGGGSPLTRNFTDDNRYEGFNTTSLVHGAHLVRFGGRVRGVSVRDQDTSDYNGTFTFNTLDAYRITLQGLANGWTTAAIRAAGGGASQFSLMGGNPLAKLSQTDVAVFGQDDWRIHGKVTLSLGLRYETQTHLADHGNVAPRVGLAWGLGKGKTPKTVLRTGAGVFYDRVEENIALDALRLDGIHQQEYVLDAPDFYPNIPSPAALASGLVPQSVRRVDSGMLAPRMLQMAIGLERQLAKNSVLTSNYVQTWGAHELRSRNINAPIGGAYPYGGNQAIYLYESSGHFRQNQWITNVTAKPVAAVSLSANYTLNRARSDTDGADTFPADSYNLHSEWGRAAFDVRHRVQLSGTLAAPWGFRLNPWLVATSGRPFNITLGRDLNGDNEFTDRPTFATDLMQSSVVRTAWGVFDTAPIPGQETIPRNYGNGPAQFAFNLRLLKVFTFGGKPDKSKSGSDPRELTLVANVRNVLNHPNYGTPDGNLSSSLFGRSTGLSSSGYTAGVRRVELQIRFNF